MMRFSFTPSKNNGSNGDRAKCKCLHKVFLRYLLYFATVTVAIPLVYVNLNVATVDIPLQPSLATKNLEGFLNIHGEESADIKSRIVAHKGDETSLVLTAYLEPPETLIETRNTQEPLVRNTTISKLQSISFPNSSNCENLMESFPVDNFPLGDPFLPWIHDYFPSLDRKSLHFVAQNRRKCDTGEENSEKMKFWTPQVALFQGIPVVAESTTGRRQSKGETGDNKIIYRLATSFQEATHDSTRFQCRFHHKNVTITTLSIFPFDYEFMNWIRGKKTMLERNGDRDAATFWLNQLHFICPIPEEFQPILSSSSSSIPESSKIRAIDDTQQPAFYVDLIPIRTPARKGYLFLSKVTETESEDSMLEKMFGRNHVLPSMDDAGRWQNLPICRRSNNLPSLPEKGTRDNSHHLPAADTLEKEKKPHRLVACTWTSSSYHRRGESSSISDSAQRLKEWIQFHLMVGVDHLYVYDNTDTAGNRNSSDVYQVTQSFKSDEVTYHAWPCKICNNNRPAHSSPGVRSSQYLAESSCRNRYGELSEWMTFIDTDEYMVPMKQDKNGEYSWYPVLDEMGEMNISIMKFLSSRGKPRIELTEELKDQSSCTDPTDISKKELQLPVENCVHKMQNKTFLQVYNCEYIRPPKPRRFQRAMKQIYRPSYVLSHFVHYSTVTNDTRSYDDFVRNHPDVDPKTFISKKDKGRKKASGLKEMFVDEMTHGVLVHARSVLPPETRRRSAECVVGSTHSCKLGFLCEDDVEFVDELHKDNIFHNADGSFCNCWRNKVIEEVLVPKLETLLSQVDKGYQTERN